MKGIASREKRYVEVISDTAQDGTITPLTIVWENGRHYRIAQVLDCRQARSLKTGASGMRYTVRVGDTATHLWYEGPRWFVEAKVATMPEW